MTGDRLIRRFAVLLCAALGGALPTTASAAGTGPYEPNDTLQTAFGPLGPSTIYSATVESSYDPDWYYVYTAGPGQVDVAVALTSCGAANPGPSCSNVQVTVYNGDGGPVGGAIVNTVNQPAHVTFEATQRWRYAISVRQPGLAGASYLLSANATGGLTTVAPGEPLPPPNDQPLPTVLERFSARFETSYVGSATRPQQRKITGLTVLGMAPGTILVVRCTKGCVRRYAKTVTARGASRRLGGLPMRLKRTTRLRIETRRPGFVGRYREYTFAPKVPVPRMVAAGCTSPYDFSTIFCAPGTD